MIDEILLEAEDKMEKAVAVVKEDLTTLRTGHATAHAFSRIMVDYYGSPTPLSQMATVTVPEARMAIIKPYDASMMQSTERAIRDSDLGVNPTTDGIVIRVIFPQLTEERRRELGKVARSKGEDAKVSIRSVRRKAKEDIDRLSKDGDVGEDEAARAEKELQAVTDKFTNHVDELVKNKEAELLEV